MNEWMKATVKKDEEKPYVLISACLLGVSCKYNGGDNRMESVEELQRHCHLVPVCPEQLGGLATPRCPAEIQGERVVTREGADVTAQYEKGAQEALKLAQMFGCRCAVLKARSPSCGSDGIYDGTFSGTLTDGDGRAAAVLKQHGITVYTEHEINEMQYEIQYEIQIKDVSGYRNDQEERTDDSDIDCRR